MTPPERDLASVAAQDIDLDANPYWLNDRWVPTDPRENVAFRKWIRKWVGHNSKRQQLVRSACAHDPLFWMQTFGWVHEPRGRKVRSRPLLLYPHQRKWVTEVYERRGMRNLGGKKTRIQGGTWGWLHTGLHCFMFEEEVQIRLMSRNWDMVDKPGNQDALFWKLRYIIKRQPPWLMPPIYDIEGLLRNLQSGCVILGSTTTAEAGVGGRDFMTFVDEISSWSIKASHQLMGTLAFTSDAVFPLATPKGMGGWFDEYIMPDKPKWDTITLAWIDNPDQTKGMYRKLNGKVDLLDKDFWRWMKVGYIRKYFDMVKIDESVPSDEPAIHHYPFVEKPNPPWDGRRSPWYDHMVNKIDNSILRASELDIERHKSADVIFDVDKLNRVLQEQPRPPIKRGTLKFDAAYFSITQQRLTMSEQPDAEEPFAMPRFREDSDGDWELWCNLNEDGRPPQNRIMVIAADVSQGSGSSCATLSVMDAEHREKIARYRSAFADPVELAQMAFAAGRWFGCKTDLEALIIWEKQGPGQTFGKRMIEYGYVNLYRHRKEEAPGENPMKAVGWPSSDRGKAEIFREYHHALFNGQITNPDEEALEELRQYHWTRAQSDRKTDLLVTFVPLETGALLQGAASLAPHGDLAMSDILAWHAVRISMPAIKEREAGPDYFTGEGEFPVNSPGYRRQQYLKRRQARKTWGSGQAWGR